MILKLYHSNLSKEVNFYLNLSKYYLYYSRIFCSILSLSCVSLFPQLSLCSNNIQSYYEYQIGIFNVSDYSNMDIIYENIHYRALFFVDFEELLFNQEKIIYNILEETKDNMIDYLAKYDNDNLNSLFEINLTYHKITQNMENNILNTTFKKEKISFGDLIILITSRFSILSQDIENIKNIRYIL